MVNALIPYLPTPKTDIEAYHIIQYLNQLHYVRGYETIYLFAPSPDITSLDFASEYPEQIEKDVEGAIEKVIERLNVILWDLKKTDYIEANLQPFISLVSLWFKAKPIKAVIIFPRLDVLSPVLHLSQVLTDDRRNFIGTVADDVELWFFSHYADIHANIPFFINFTHKIRNSIISYIDVDLLQKLLNDLCNYPTSSLEWKKRDQILLMVVRYWKQVLRQVQSKYRNQIIVTSTPIAVSNKNLSSFEKLNWKHKNLLSIFKDFIFKDSNFDPYFIIDSMYPKKLFKEIKLLKIDSKEKIKALINFTYENKGHDFINLAYQKFVGRLADL